MLTRSTHDILWVEVVHTLPRRRSLRSLGYDWTLLVPTKHFLKMSTNNIFNALSSPPPSDSNINGRAGNNDDLLHNASILAGDGNNKKKKKRKKKKKKKNVETGGCDVAIENSDAGTNLKNQINDAVKNNVFVQQKESAGYGNGTEGAPPPAPSAKSTFAAPPLPPPTLTATIASKPGQEVSTTVTNAQSLPMQKVTLPVSPITVGNKKTNAHIETRTSPIKNVISTQEITGVSPLTTHSHGKNVSSLTEDIEHDEAGEETFEDDDDEEEYEEEEDIEDEEEFDDTETTGDTDDGEESSYEESSDEDYSDDDDEGADGYKIGGYHPVKLGEVYNSKYLVLKKLGWGHFSTVWLVSDSNDGRNVALKIQKSAEHYTEAAWDEIELLKAVQQGAKKIGVDDVPVVQLLDSFEHVGPNGTHVGMVFEALGENLLSLIKRYNYTGIPLPVVRHISRQILIGLDFLHRICQIIHTDLKPENVLLAKPADYKDLKRIASHGGSPPVSNAVDVKDGVKKDDAKVNKALDEGVDWSKLTPEERKKLKKKLKRKKQKEKKKAAKLAAANAKQDTTLKQLNVTTVAASSTETAVKAEDGNVDTLATAVESMSLKERNPDKSQGLTAVPKAIKLNSTKPYVHNLYAPNFNLDSCGTGEPVSFEWNKAAVPPSEWKDPDTSKSCKVAFITSYGVLVKALGLPTQLALGPDNALDKENNKSEADERSWYMCVQHREDVSPNNKARFAVRCIGDDKNRTLREFRDSCGIDTIEYGDSEEEDDDITSEAGDDDNVEKEAEDADDVVGNDEDPDVVWQVIFDAKYALVVLSFLEHKVDDLVFLRYKCVMESDGDFETSPTSNHSDPKLKIVSKSQDSNANDGALKDSRRRFNVAKKQMADGFFLLGKPCGTCNFDGYIMGLSLCPDSPLTLEGVSVLSNATPSSLLPNNLTTVSSENDVPPAPQAPVVSDSNGIPPLPEPAPITRVVSTEEPSVSRGRDSLQQVMTFPIKDRLDGWPVALVDFNLSSAPSKNLKDDINFATVQAFNASPENSWFC